jgi:precorrin-2 dehydrogenase / sirohydrochlorin ferrochelatase
MREKKRNARETSFYPIFVDLTGKKVVLVGGGAVAQRKAQTLLGYGADIALVCRDMTPALRGYVDSGEIQFRDSEFREDHLENAFMVVAATDDSTLNHRISQISRKRGLLVNAVDQPADCSFIVPAILRRGDLVIAVSTSGKSPALAKKIREDLGEKFGTEYEAFLRILGRLREEIFSRGLSQQENSRLFHRLIDSPILEALARQDWEKAASLLNHILQTRYSSEEVMHLSNES